MSVGQLIVLDLETTGLDPYIDRIVQIALVNVDDRSVLLNEVLNPGMPIGSEATGIHGMTNSDVADSPTFDDIAYDVQRQIEGAVLVTYNGRSLDVPMLDAELRRADQVGIDLKTQREVDLYRVWLAAEPRTLAGAARRFLATELDQQHDASEDALVTADLLWAMGMGFDLTSAQMEAETRPDGEVDRTGRLSRDDDGTLRFAFGKHKGDRVVDRPGYVRWMLGASFPPDTVEALRVAIGGGG